MFIAKNKELSSWRDEASWKFHIFCLRIDEKQLKTDLANETGFGKKTRFTIKKKQIKPRRYRFKSYQYFFFH